MVLTVNNFTGFETQGTEEASATGGIPTYPTDKPRSGAAYLNLDAATESYTLDIATGGVTDAGDDYIIGFSVKFTSVTNDTTGFFGLTDAGGEFGRVQMGASGILEVVDQAGTTVLSSTTTFIIDQQYYIELYFETDGTDNCELFVNNLSEDSVTDNSADFINSGAVSSIVFRYDGTNTIAIDDVYILSGATAASDRFGPVEVYMKQGAQTGVSPDVTAALNDTDLDEGSWQLASETPLNEQSQTAAASYTGTVNASAVVYSDGAGDKLGPNGDDRFLGGTILAMKGIWRMARSGGGSTTQFGILGNDGGEGTDTGITSDLDLTAEFVNYETIKTSVTLMPTVTENAAIGFEKNSGGQDLDCAEMWVMLLFQPVAPTITALSDSDLEYPDQNYFVGPFEI